MKKILWMAVLILLMGGHTGYAHHLWVFEEEGRFVVARGHMPERVDDYDPQCVTIVKGYDNTGSLVPVERKDENTRTVFFSNHEISMLTVGCDWGYRVNTTQGKKLISRTTAANQGLTVISAFFSTQFLKCITENTKACTQPVGLKLEITPLKLPSKLTAGELLPLQVCFEGKPLANASVISAREISPVKTDQSGVAQISLPENGEALISVRHKMPIQDDPNRDYHLFTTFLMVKGE